MVTLIKTKFNYFKTGISNLWNFRKVIWRFRWYDYTFISNIMYQIFDELDKNWDKSIHVGYKKEHKNIKITKEILKRISDEDYFFNSKGKVDFKKTENIYNMYYDILSKRIKNLRQFWD